MIKTFLVLYLLSNPIFTLGPYPDGADEVCRTGAVELQEKARDHWLEFQKIVQVPIKPIDLNAECIQSEQRPTIADEVPLD